MVVNGKGFLLKNLVDTRLITLVEYLGLNPNTVAIERNGKIEDRNHWNEIILSDDDNIELIKFVGGG